MRASWRMLLTCGAVIAALASQATATAQADGGPAAASLRWRVVSTVGQAKFNGMFAVDAISSREAWAGGCGQARQQQPGPKPFAIPAHPVLQHYAGGDWRPVSVPKGLAGCVTSIDSTSAANVWAFGWSENASFTVRAYALHLVHGRWVVAKRWGPAGPSAFPVGTVVLGKTDAWVFFQDATVEHLDGTGWHRSVIKLPAGPQGLQAASKDSHGGIWVLTDQSYVMRLQVTAGHDVWKPLLLPDPSFGLTGIYAATPRDVWVCGGSQGQSHGHTVFVPTLDHWTGSVWRQVKVSGNFPLRSVTGDGHGGLWLNSDWASPGVPPFPVHYTGGRLVADPLARRGGQYVGTYAIAQIPGSQSAWGAGALSGKGGLKDTGGVLLKYGH